MPTFIKIEAHLIFVTKLGLSCQKLKLSIPTCIIKNSVIWLFNFSIFIKTEAHLILGPN